MKQTMFFELPLQVFLSIRPDFSKFFPASSFSSDEPYWVRFASGSDGRLFVEVGYKGDKWFLGAVGE